MLNKEQITEYFKTLQGAICNALEAADAKGKFQQDDWWREGGGGGRSRVLEEGNIIEKGGVGFSAVHGALPPSAAAALNTNVQDTTFYATGVSIVLHPHSPMIPIIHMNVRYFEMSNGTWWFGGGIDLTPHYVDADDAKYFHSYLKSVCDQFDTNYYPTYKTWADDYFYIRHRKETRGIGGIFFDHLNEKEGKSKEAIFEFVKAVGEAFAPIYTYYMQKNKDLPYGESEKHWQGLRRGRYVEFNLVWDRGTKFGLETDGRTESILMSLPKTANWLYNHQPDIESKEAQTLALLKKGIDWLA